MKIQFLNKIVMPRDHSKDSGLYEKRPYEVPEMSSAAVTAARFAGDELERLVKGLRATDTMCERS